MRTLEKVFLLLLVMIFVGCTTSAEPHRSSASPFKLNTSTDMSEHFEISIGFWNIDEMVSPEEDALLALIEELFNITIVPKSVDWSGYKKEYQIMGVTNSLPDVFASLTISSTDNNDSSSLSNMVEQRLIRPLPTDLRAFPNVEKIYTTYDFLPTHGGKYFYIPRLSYQDISLTSSDAGMLVRKDWMDTLGIKPPESFAEFSTMCTRFALEDPDGNGLDDTIGYNVNNTDVLGKWLMFGIAPECSGFSWIKTEAGFVPFYTLPSFFDVVVDYRQLYATNALDPNFHLKKTNDAVNDFAGGTLGALEYKTSADAVRVLQNQWELSQDESFEDSVSFLNIFPYKGEYYSNSSNPFWSESLFSIEVSDEKMNRILLLYDFLLSEDGINLMKRGIPFVDYEMIHGEYRSLSALGELNLTDFLFDKYPSLSLFSSLAAWGGTADDFEMSSYNVLRYGSAPSKIATDSLAWNLENTIQVVRPYDFLLIPKESSYYFNTSQVIDDFINVIIAQGDPVTLWETVLDTYEKNGLADYIQRQNDNYYLQKETS